MAHIDDSGMHGKICMVTGASAGMGEATALALARMGATVVMVCRNQEKGERVRAAIQARSGNQAVDLLIADLASQHAIHQLVQTFKDTYQHLHVLVNNAGLSLSKRTMTEDGLEMTFAVNHLAYFLLTGLLLDTLKASAPARIINVSSSIQTIGTIDFNDIQGEKRYSAVRSYAQSKLANIMFTYELARRLEGTSVTANCLHPGAVASNFGMETGGLFGFVLKLAKPFEVNSTRGARTAIYLASSPIVEGVNGKFFANEKAIKSSRQSYNLAAQQRLWQLSEQLTKLAV